MKTILSVCFIFIQTMVLFAQDSLINHKPFCWYKADKNIGITDFWQDLSGNNRHASPAFNQSMPDLSMLNYNPSYVLDGIDNGFVLHSEFSEMKSINIITSVA
jgi:hypothetical protein